jgi:hypothetical protein
MAFNYSLEVSSDNITFTTQCDQCYTDHQTPVSATLDVDVAFVRVTPFSRDGVQGPTAAPYAIPEV